MNIVEKILSSHSESPGKTVGPGDIVRTSVDKVIMLDIAGLHPEFVNNPPKRPFDVGKLSIVFDHYIPPPTVEVAEAIGKIRTLAKRWGVEQFYDMGKGGISHALAAEQGWLLPGRIIANTDSHTCATGAYNCLGRGLGMPELMYVICTGETWYIVGETIKVNLEGALQVGVESKDVFLQMASVIGDIPNDNIEFGGRGLTKLSIDDRAVISTMCAEMSAEFAIFPHDAMLEEYLRARAEASYAPVSSDERTDFKENHAIDLTALSPLVALPDSVSKNIKPVAEVDGTKVDQAVIGSCANGRLADLEVAARVLENRRVHRDTRLIVTPATQAIALEADKRGFISTILGAGGTVTNPTCGSCFGGHMGLLSAGETCVTSTTRNFKGRMGSRDAKIYMASSATVAASAVAGVITDPRKFLEGGARRA